MGYLVDSNVLIDYVAERFEIHQLKTLDLIFDEELCISATTKIEVLGYNGEKEEQDKMLLFVNNSTIIPINDEVVERTILIKKLIKIKTPDAIIASTALVLGYTLITNNFKDFNRVAGLKLLASYEI
jgi:predicted nucleic acid-binding protein